MKELLDKLSSYNVFNYLFPGVLFAAFVSWGTSFTLLADNIVVGAFLYYFYGLIVSRVGSLVLEPLLKRYGIVRFAQYADYVAASRTDPTLETLSEQNNTYRTLAAMVVCVSVAAAVDRTLKLFPRATVYARILGAFLLLLLFILSYRKQTKYVVARVEANRASGTNEAKGGSRAVT
jgi:hypothetical protein